MYLDHKTLTGHTIDELRRTFDEELPPDAYKKVPSASYLTDINPAYMRQVLTEVFGLGGIGWGYRYDPATVSHRVFDFTTSQGEVKTRHEAIVTGLVFWFKMVNAQGQYVTCEIPATGGSENTSAAFALKGALTNAIGNAVSNLGFQESVYLGKRDHRTVKRNGKGNGHRGNGSSGNGSSAADVEVKFGKYQGMTLGDVYATDPSYVEWLAENWNWQRGRDAAAAILAHYTAKEKATSDAPPF